MCKKNGSLKETRIRNFDVDELYKKCGFRKNTNFSKKTSWNKNINGENICIELWAKDKGKANTENKYDFPPPVDNNLFFGHCALVSYEDNDVVDLTKKKWLKVYEHLFGGFEDLSELAEADNNEEDELDNIPPDMKTKAGYLKDGFVVDTNSDDAIEDPNDEDEESEESTGSSEYEEDEQNNERYSDSSDDEDSFNSDSELSEEDYCYSDED